MTLVVAKSKGYFGGVIRDVGEAFEVPDDLFEDPKRRPSWVTAKGDAPKPAPFVAVGSDPASTVEIPSDWQSKSAAERKALAKLVSGQNIPNATEADKIILTYMDASKPAPFSDAPAPEIIVGNGVQQALGGVQPDWVDPSHQAPAQVD